MRELKEFDGAKLVYTGKEESGIESGKDTNKESGSGKDDTKGAKNVQTGDDNPIVLYLCLEVAALAIILAMKKRVKIKS